MNILGLVISLVIISFLVFPKNLQAYLDPGTGSYIIQVILAFVIGGLYGCKIYWERIKAFFRNSKSKEEDEKEEDESETHPDEAKD